VPPVSFVTERRRIWIDDPRRFDCGSGSSPSLSADMSRAATGDFVAVQQAYVLRTIQGAA
jgi:hypothetical protein